MALLPDGFLTSGILSRLIGQEIFEICPSFDAFLNTFTPSSTDEELDTLTSTFSITATCGDPAVTITSQAATIVHTVTFNNEGDIFPSAFSDPDITNCVGTFEAPAQEDVSAEVIQQFAGLVCGATGGFLTAIANLTALGNDIPTIVIEDQVTAAAFGEQALGEELGDDFEPLEPGLTELVEFLNASLVESPFLVGLAAVLATTTDPGDIALALLQLDPDFFTSLVDQDENFLIENVDDLFQLLGFNDEHIALFTPVFDLLEDLGFDIFELLNDVDADADADVDYYEAAEDLIGSFLNENTTLGEILTLLEQFEVEIDPNILEAALAVLRLNEDSTLAESIEALAGFPLAALSVLGSAGDAVDLILAIYNLVIPGRSEEEIAALTLGDVIDDVITPVLDDVDSILDNLRIQFDAAAPTTPLFSLGFAFLTITLVGELEAINEEIEENFFVEEIAAAFTSAAAGAPLLDGPLTILEVPLDLNNPEEAIPMSLSEFSFEFGVSVPEITLNPVRMLQDVLPSEITDILVSSTLFAIGEISLDADLQLGFEVTVNEESSPETFNIDLSYDQMTLDQGISALVNFTALEQFTLENIVSVDTLIPVALDFGICGVASTGVSTAAQAILTEADVNVDLSAAFGGASGELVDFLLGILGQLPTELFDALLRGTLGEISFQFEVFAEDIDVGANACARAGIVLDDDDEVDVAVVVGGAAAGVAVVAVGAAVATGAIGGSGAAAAGAGAAAAGAGGAAAAGGAGGSAGGAGAAGKGAADVKVAVDGTAAVKVA